MFFFLNSSIVKCFDFLGGKCYVNEESAVCFPSRHLYNGPLEPERNLPSWGTSGVFT